MLIFYDVKEFESAAFWIWNIQSLKPLNWNGITTSKWPREKSYTVISINTIVGEYEQFMFVWTLEEITQNDS